MEVSDETWCWDGERIDPGHVAGPRVWSGENAGGVSSLDGEIADPRTSKPPTSRFRSSGGRGGIEEVWVRIIAFFPMDDAASR